MVTSPLFSGTGAVWTVWAGWTSWTAAALFWFCTVCTVWGSGALTAGFTGVTTTVEGAGPLYEKVLSSVFTVCEPEETEELILPFFKPLNMASATEMFSSPSSTPYGFSIIMSPGRFRLGLSVCDKSVPDREVFSASCTLTVFTGAVDCTEADEAGCTVAAGVSSEVFLVMNTGSFQVLINRAIFGLVVALSPTTLNPREAAWSLILWKSNPWRSPAFSRARIIGKDFKKSAPWHSSALWLKYSQTNAVSHLSRWRVLIRYPSVFNAGPVDMIFCLILRFWNDLFIYF